MRPRLALNVWSSADVKLTLYLPAARGTLLALGWVLVLTGCASIPPARPAVAPEALAARARLEQRWEEFHDLRSLAEITIRRRSRVQRLTGVLLLRAPSSLRFEALSPFGTPVYVIAGDAKTLTVWEVLDQRAFVLPSSAEASRRWLGLAIGVDELVAVLAGRVLPLKDAQDIELLAPDGASPSLSLRGLNGVQRIWFDPATGQAREVQWTDGPNPARVVFAEASADSPPLGATLATLDGTLEVQVKYREPRMNTSFDPDLLKLSVPEHVKIQDLR
jgi:outer membrane lipoprotein-sorting protein